MGGGPKSGVFAAPPEEGKSGDFAAPPEDGKSGAEGGAAGVGDACTDRKDCTGCFWEEPRGLGLGPGGADARQRNSRS